MGRKLPVRYKLPFCSKREAISFGNMVIILVKPPAFVRGSVRSVTWDEKQCCGSPDGKDPPVRVKVDTGRMENSAYFSHMSGGVPASGFLDHGAPDLPGKLRSGLCVRTLARGVCQFVPAARPCAGKGTKQGPLAYLQKFQLLGGRGGTSCGKKG